MSFNGVIFDFNGTLFWDTPYHNQAWNTFLKAHNIQLSDDEMIRKVHGKPNSEIFREIFGNDITEEDIERMIFEKETIYRRICSKRTMELAPGAIDLLEWLLGKRIPFTIATASGKGNLDFYFEQLLLGKWFDFRKVIYDNESFRGKPNPDTFLLAARQLQLHPEEIVVFEDSFAGILAAQNAGAGKIYIVNSNNDDYRQWQHDKITDFAQVSRNIFYKDQGLSS